MHPYQLALCACDLGASENLTTRQSLKVKEKTELDDDDDEQ